MNTVNMVKDSVSNDLDGAEEFESNQPELYGSDEHDCTDDEPGALTVGQLIDALSRFDDETRVSIAYAHNGAIGYSDIMGVAKNGESVQLSELEYFRDSEDG